MKMTKNQIKMQSIKNIFQDTIMSTIMFTLAAFFYFAPNLSTHPLLMMSGCIVVGLVIYGYVIWSVVTFNELYN